jgi:hypothetical protein
MYKSSSVCLHNHSFKKITMDVPTIVRKGRGVNLVHNGYRYSKDKKNTAGVQYWK